jgi:HEAT repeat protein
MNALIVLNFAVREEAIEHIVSCFKDEQPDIRIRAALNLIAYKAKYNMDLVVEPLTELLNDNDPNVRMVAESVLSYVAK